MIKVFLKFNFFLFPFVWMLAFVFSVLESFTYSGFLPGTRFFLIWAVLSGALVRTMPPKKKVSKQWLSRFKNLFVFNKFVFFLTLVTTATTLFLEGAHYSNYVFSRIHLQPQLLIRVCFLSGFLVLLDLSRLDKRWFLEKLFKERGLTRGLSRALYLFFTIFFLAFVIYNSATLATKFYQDELKPEREIEIQYALREINIYQWIEEYFPKMKDVIFWCENQPEKKELVAFDPDIIWYGYEGLMRVFMANCNIKHGEIINLPAEEVVSSLKEEKESFLIVSLNKCKKEIKSTKMRRSEDEVEYLGQVNNDIMCNSEKVLPGLYRFPVTE